MDFLSHILVGKIISSYQKKTAQLWAMFFSFLPDLFQLPAYIYLGYINNRPFFIPQNVDWNHTRNAYPFLHAITWEIPHSVFFLLLIILPIVFYFKLPKVAFLAYFTHILIDIPSHADEWALKPFYPLNYTFSGFTNAWAWPLYYMFLSWAALFLIIVLLHDRPVNEN